VSEKLPRKRRAKTNTYPCFSGLFRKEKPVSGRRDSRNFAEKRARECHANVAGESLTPDALKVLTKNRKQAVTGCVRLENWCGRLSAIVSRKIILLIINRLY
jgi:hypothetical protein